MIPALLAIYAAAGLIVAAIIITIREDDRYFVASADAARDRILSPLPAPGREDGASPIAPVGAVLTTVSPVQHEAPNA